MLTVQNFLSVNFCSIYEFFLFNVQNKTPPSSAICYIEKNEDSHCYHIKCFKIRVIAVETYNDSCSCWKASNVSNRSKKRKFSFLLRHPKLLRSISKPSRLSSVFQSMRSSLFSPSQNWFVISWMKGFPSVSWLIYQESKARKNSEQSLQGWIKNSH